MRTLKQIKQQDGVNSLQAINIQLDEAKSGCASVNGSAAAIADALDAVLSAVHSVHTSMAFTPLFARHYLEADAKLIREAREKINLLRRQNT